MTIGVLFGSRSPEHDVSIITGQLVISGLKELNHTVVPIYISRDGTWYADEMLGDLDFFKSPNYQMNLEKFGNFVVDLSQIGKMVLRRQGFMTSKQFTIDIVFPAIHGQNGEDGTVQGLCELLNVPYTGCDIASSAIGMDKVLTKLMYQSLSIPTTKFKAINTTDWIYHKDIILKDLDRNFAFPLFVKPSRLGSSIGISKVKNMKDLEFSIEVAMHYDDKILVEEGVENLMDITVSVMGNENPITSEIQESAYTDDFFTYEDKYLREGGTQLGNAQENIIIPARLDKKTTEDIKETAVAVYKALGCSGIARVDFLYDKTFNKAYANEVNTLPGTLYHHLWKASGVELKDLLAKLIEYAKEKYEKKQKLTYTFESEILKKANSTKLQLKGGS